MTIKNEAKKNSIAKPIIITLISFLLVPLLTATIVYYTNANFRYRSNEFLSTILPGSLGRYFDKQPTEAERNELNRLIAKHYITYDEDRLLDKLLLIKGEDPQLYNELLILLTRENGTKMAKVKENLRIRELSSDTLQRILEEIEVENQDAVDALTKYYTSLKTSKAVAEIQRTFKSGELTLDQLPILFEKLPLQTGAKYLMELDEDLQQKIRFRLTDSRKNELDKQIEAIKRQEATLVAAAKVLENKPENELVSEIGGLNQYTIEDLAVIYSNLSLEKGGRTLSKVTDETFVNDLYDAITEYEALEQGTDQFARNLSAARKIYVDYNKKVNELVSIYEKMSVEELASIADQMLKSNQTYQRHTIQEGIEITFTQEELVVDVFRQLKPKMLASVMEQMDTTRAVELSKKLMIH